MNDNPNMRSIEIDEGLDGAERGEMESGGGRIVRTREISSLDGEQSLSII